MMMKKTLFGRVGKIAKQGTSMRNVKKAFETPAEEKKEVPEAVKEVEEEQ